MLVPIKDPERKKEVVAAWRKRAHTPAYMKWLYARRKINADLVAMYEVVLQALADDGYQFPKDALRHGDEMRREVGNRFNHETDEPYWKEEA